MADFRSATARAAALSAEMFGVNQPILENGQAA
jgi:hypothetical protein